MKIQQNRGTFRALMLRVVAWDFTNMVTDIGATYKLGFS
jgi:hypothetical protein